MSRTTITLDAGLHADARSLADALGCTFSELVEAALRERLARAVSAPEVGFELVTYGGDGLRDGLGWADVEALAADLEAGRYPEPGVSPPLLAAERSSP